jgi:hypothetical protein
MSVTHNASTSPEGLTNAAKIIPNTTSTFHRVKDNEGVASTTFAQSVFAKSDGYDFIALENGGELAFFNLSTGEVGYTSNGTASIEDFGDGWYRCIFTATALNNKSFMYVTDADNNLTFAGDGTKGVLIYGAQYEQASYPTSYIPTYGSAVTRSQDTGSLNLVGAGVNDGWISGTILIEFEKPYNNENADAIRIHGNSVTGRAYIYNNGYGFASDFSYSSNFTIGDNNKIIYRLNTLSTANLFKNGVKLTGAEGSGTAWSDIKYIYLNNQGGAKINIKQIVVFPTALTDSECIKLTEL